MAERGRWKELRALVDARVKANPDDAEAEWLLSRVRIAFHDVDGALAPAQKAVALAPGNAEYLWQLAQVYGGQAERAGVLHQLGLARKFKSEAEAALTIAPNLVDALMGLMEFYERAPGVAGGDDQKAQALAKRLGAISKADGILARIRLRQQDKSAPSNTELARLYQDAIQADPSRYEPRIDLANVEIADTPAHLDAAAHEALTARKIDPDRIDAYRVLAGVYATEANWSGLENDLTEAERRVPGDGSPWLTAACAMLGTNTELPRAERYVRKYLSIEPEPDEPTHAYAHWQLGLILEKEGRTAEAIGELKTALQLDPKLDGARQDLKRVGGSRPLSREP